SGPGWGDEDEPEDESRQNLQTETGDHGLAGGLETVDLADHVAEDVGEGEQERAAVGDDGAEADDLRGRDVRDDEHRAEHGEEDPVVTSAGGREGGQPRGGGGGRRVAAATRLSRLALRRAGPALRTLLRQR